MNIIRYTKKSFQLLNKNCRPTVKVMGLLSAIGPCEKEKYCEEVRKKETVRISRMIERTLGSRTRCFIRLIGPRSVGKSCSLHFISRHVSRKRHLLYIPLITHRLGSFSQIHRRIVHFFISRDLPFLIRSFRGDDASASLHSRELLHKLVPEEKHKNIEYEIYRAFDRLILYMEEFETDPFLLYNAVRTIQSFLDALLVNLYCLMREFDGVLLTLDDFEHCWQVWSPLQRMRFWKGVVNLINIIKPPLILCCTANDKLIEDVDYLREYISDTFVKVEDIYFRSLSVSDIEMVCKRYLNGVDNEQRALVSSSLRKLRMVSLRTVLQVLYSLGFSVGWQKTQAAALEVAQQILTARDKILHRELVEEMKKLAGKKFGVKPSDKEILLAVKWPRDKENLRRILESLPPDLDAAIDYKIAEWFKQKGLSAALEKVRNTKTCPWCKRSVKSPIAYNFLVHLRWCSIASSLTSILGFRQYEIDSLLKRLRWRMRSSAL